MAEDQDEDLRRNLQGVSHHQLRGDRPWQILAGNAGICAAVQGTLPDLGKGGRLKPNCASLSPTLRTGVMLPISRSLPAPRSFPFGQLVELLITLEKIVEKYEAAYITAQFVEWIQRKATHN